MKTHTLSSEQASREFTAEFLKKIILERSDRGATVMALSGDLGTGKTFFVKEIAKGLGVLETVTSPTFVLARFYDLPTDKPWKKLIHIDAYRLERVEDLIGLGWGKWVSDPNNIVCVEWPEKIFSKGQLKDFTRLYFGWVNENTRSVRV